MSDDKPVATARGARSPLLLALAGVVLLGAIGGGAYYAMHLPPSAPPPPEPGILALDPFVVNLADAGGQRFLRVTLRLVLESKEQAAELEEDEVRKVRARSAILELLSEQHADKLTAPAGKAELKKTISEHVSHALEHVKVTDVLFTEFVVQF
jgi:flagellar FliL protein